MVGMEIGKRCGEHGHIITDLFSASPCGVARAGFAVRAGLGDSLLLTDRSVSTGRVQRC